MWDEMIAEAQKSENFKTAISLLRDCLDRLQTEKVRADEYEALYLKIRKERDLYRSMWKSANKRFKEDYDKKVKRASEYEKQKTILSNKKC